MDKQFTIDQAKTVVEEVLKKQGFLPSEIEYIVDVIIYGALTESSQGINKLFGWHASKDSRADEPIILHESPNIIRCDSKRNHGMYANSLAVDSLLKNIGNSGIALAGVFNFSSSSGAISYYTKKLSQKGLVGIMLASADPIGGIAPPGRSVGVFGTNPLSISVPYKSSDITLDMSTASYTWGALLQADIQNKKLQPGYAYDSNGNPTTDPKEAMDGTVSSFDSSYKGLGLAFMIQILAGALIGSVYEQSDEACDYGSLIIAIDPNKLGGLEFMQEQVTKMLAALKNGQEDVFYPGEQSQKRYQDNLSKNAIIIDENTWDKIEKFLLNV